MRLHRIDQTTDDGWRLFPLVCRRIAAFCATHRTDLTGEELVRLARAHFVACSPALGLWAAEEDGAVVGHLFALFDEAHKVVFVYQVAVAKSVTAAVRAQGWLELETWARLMGATAIDAQTWHRGWIFAYLGFRPHRTVVRKELTHG